MELLGKELTAIFGPLGAGPMGYALIFPLWMNFLLLSTVQVFRATELHCSVGAIPIEDREDALAAIQLVPGTICRNFVVTLVLWLLSARRRLR